MDRMISNTSKKPSCVDLPDVFTRYPNIADFRKKYCEDCSNRCDVPSIEIFSCILEKLSNKDNKKDVEK